MIAFKGFTQDLRSVLGNGREESCSFKPGITMTETECKTGRNGYHCCENPFDCLSYYSLNGKNRFFRVEASGDINEDRYGRIACTRITLLEELDTWKMAFYGMKYIIEHPDREKWQQDYRIVTVAMDSARAYGPGQIAIARGGNPKVEGPAGSILGLLADGPLGIDAAKLLLTKESQAGRWLRLSGNKVVMEEMKDEEKAG